MVVGGNDRLGSGPTLHSGAAGATGLIVGGTTCPGWPTERVAQRVTGRVAWFDARSPNPTHHPTGRTTHAGQRSRGDSAERSPHQKPTRLAGAPAGGPASGYRSAIRPSGLPARRRFGSRTSQGRRMSGRRERPTVAVCVAVPPWSAYASGSAVEQSCRRGLARGTSQSSCEKGCCGSRGRARAGCQLLLGVVGLEEHPVGHDSVDRLVRAFDYQLRTELAVLDGDHRVADILL